MNTRARDRRDFTEGPIFYRMILFALPIMMTGILQICYNMADNIIVGRYSGDTNALAAVGCTSSFSNLIINLLLGFAGGTGVVVAQLYGARADKALEKTVHTAISFSLMFGCVLTVIGLLISEPVLVLMGTKAEILDRSLLYIRIIFLGIPASAVYNLGAAVLRATGNSKIPLAILGVTGFINVVFNLIFVICFKMTVDGVALATIISQYLSAVCVIAVLIMKKGESYAFSFKKLCFDFRLLGRVLRYGIPAGLQSSMFSISNMMIASAVNTFPTTTVSANTISSNIDAIAYTSVNSFSQASMTFAGQNYGAGKVNRLKKVYRYSVANILLFGISIGQLVRLFVRPLASLYVSTADPNYDAIIATVIQITTLLLSTYFICGLMDMHSGFLRGIGYSLIPMITNLVTICGIRILWIYLVFPLEKMNNHIGLYISYPVSWGIAFMIFAVISIFAIKNLQKKMQHQSIEKNEKVNTDEV